MNRLTITLLPLLLWCGSALSHPHAWIDISAEVRFDSAGRLTVLDQTWLFDEFYTAQMVGKGEPMQIERVAARMFNNLKAYDYFTHLQAGGRPLAIMEAQTRSARMIGGRLAIRFALPLSEPVAPSLAKPVTYQVFDPTYYIEMLHREGEDAIRLQAAPASCQARRIAPRPDAQAVIAAAALDRNQTARTGLGKFFAETVKIWCEAKP